MSELWNVRVDEVASSSVGFSVESVHPDSGPFPVTRRFALDILFDHRDALVPDGLEIGAVGDEAEIEAAALVTRLDIVARRPRGRAPPERRRLSRWEPRHSTAANTSSEIPLLHARPSRARARRGQRPMATDSVSPRPVAKTWKVPSTPPLRRLMYELPLLAPATMISPSAVAASWLTSVTLP